MGRFSPRHASDKNTQKLVNYVNRVPGAKAFVVGNLIDEFDVIVGYRSRTLLLEVKNPDSDHGVTDSQRRFSASWPGHWAQVETESDIKRELEKIDEAIESRR